MATTDFTEYPWAKRNRYMRPCLPMQGDTVYNTSYLNNCIDGRRCGYKRPTEDDIISMGITTDPLTTYTTSYEPTEGHMQGRQMRSEPPIDNLGLPEGEISRDSVTKMSYPGWIGVLPPNPVSPYQGADLLGRGPMTSLTTNRVEYTPKTTSKITINVPEDAITVPLDPFDGRTTFKLSYKQHDLRCIQPSLSYQPQYTFTPTEGASECDTINRLSYTGAQPCKRVVIASRYRAQLPPLSEEERALVCDPGSGVWVPKPPAKKVSSQQPDDSCLGPRMDISRPRENSVPLIENVKGYK